MAVPRPIARVPLAVVASLVVALVFACEFRQDVIECEDAVAHLQQCCAGFDSRSVACEYEEGSCNSGPTYPQLNVQTSRCIRNTSCATLVSSDACHRLVCP